MVWEIEGSPDLFPWKKEMPISIGTETGPHGGYYPGKCDFVFKSVQIPVQVYRRLQNAYFEGREEISAERFSSAVESIEITPESAGYWLNWNSPGGMRTGLAASIWKESLELLAASLRNFSHAERPKRDCVGLPELIRKQ